MEQPAWNTVRLFLSSTFSDLHAERDYLVTVVVPRLRQWCEQHRLFLWEIDLRWGITPEQAENGRAIQVCLEEVDHCRPFFLAFLGERYGWVADDYPRERDYVVRFFGGHTDKSVTHIETLYAIGEGPGLPGQEPPGPSEQVFFFFRRPSGG